jgi:hypothetical protein
MKGKPLNIKKEPSVIESINRSRKLSAKMKEDILKYTSPSSSRYNEGRVFGLIIPTGMSKISKKISGCSLGADKNGFFVYTHRCKSNSFPTPLKIDKKSIDFVESTG